MQMTMNFKNCLYKYNFQRKAIHLCNVKSKFKYNFNFFNLLYNRLTTTFTTIYYPPLTHHSSSESYLNQQSYKLIIILINFHLIFWVYLTGLPTLLKNTVYQALIVCNTLTISMVRAYGLNFNEGFPSQLVLCGLSDKM